jgi:hypothetical protein
MLSMFLGIGGMASMIIRARARYGGRHGPAVKAGPTGHDVQLAALKSYERLAKEKLDVLRRAIDLGWGDADLKALDARLEQLVGREGIERIAKGELLSKDMAASALTPDQELARLKSHNEG